MRIESVRNVAAAAGLMLAFAGCTPHIERISLDTGRLVASANAQGVAHVACPVHLRTLVDERGADNRLGGISDRLFQLDDVPGLVRKQLLAMGLSGDDAPGRLQVDVHILKFYLTGAGITKLPVVVYEGRINDQPSFLIRSQQMSMNWAGTDSEAYAALARSFQDANMQLVARLQEQCGHPG
ncbi:MAG TPA: hypothetical protein VGH80_02415 [Xanthomonadaceae bacterium]|jgi:hypothetical protein